MFNWFFPLYGNGSMEPLFLQLIRGLTSSNTYWWMFLFQGIQSFLVTWTIEHLFNIQLFKSHTESANERPKLSLYLKRNTEASIPSPSSLKLLFPGSQNHATKSIEHVKIRLERIQKESNQPNLVDLLIIRITQRETTRKHQANPNNHTKSRLLSCEISILNTDDCLSSSSFPILEWKSHLSNGHRIPKQKSVITKKSPTKNYFLQK